MIDVAGGVNPQIELQFCKKNDGLFPPFPPQKSILCGPSERLVPYETENANVDGKEFHESGEGGGGRASQGKMKGGTIG